MSSRDIFCNYTFTTEKTCLVKCFYTDRNGTFTCQGQFDENRVKCVSSDKYCFLFKKQNLRGCYSTVNIQIQYLKSFHYNYKRVQHQLLHCIYSNQLSVCDCNFREHRQLYCKTRSSFMNMHAGD